ncbi:MAG: hypothetical protein H5U09_00650 [Desulfomicrobiaceae bacterium]|jgi:chromosomal replication initiator protein|nr:hypothetical protein [Desulfomicrobiaceae bacterium]
MTTPDLHTLRDTVRQALLTVLSAPEMEGWFDSLDFSQEGNELSVRLRQPDMAPWFSESVLPLFVQALTPRGLAVRLVPQALPFGEEFRLDEFLANSKNAFPLASAREVAEDQSARFNPLTVCGESGSGKTFLLRAIANAKALQGRRVLASTVADLATEYDRRSDARTWVLDHDVFVLDDLQDLEFHDTLQGEIILLFDRFHAGRRQMVFSCTGTLAACSFLQPKLRSRLEWGLMIALKAPDLDVRLQFVRRWRKRHGLTLSRDREILLAQRFTDMRLLEGTLLKLLAYTDLVSPHISDDEFFKILSYSTTPAQAAPITAHDIMDAVSQTLGVRREDLIAHGRQRAIAWARHVAMYLCRKHLRLSYPELARLFGGRDHTTAIYACRKVESDMARDPGRKAQVHEISRRIRAASSPSTE